MALPGYYKVNFTDPRKEGFIIEPYQTNGTISPVSQNLHNSAARADTSLLLYGRDVPNYGERVAENFVQLLENFAGPAEPQNPIEGQIWFDTGTIYTVSAWSSATTLVFIGDVVAAFNGFRTAGTTLTLSFNPVNAAIDNTLQTVSLKVASATLVNASSTSVTFTSGTGQPISLPATTIGGFIAADTPTYSRLRVATTLNGNLKWVDVTNVLSATAAPEATTRTIGDLWYDQTTSELRIYTQSGWNSVAAKYVPLAGGTMTGALQMGTNKVFSSGTITAVSSDLYALVNRAYVDSVQSSLQTQLTTLSDRVDDIGTGSSTGLDKKVNKAGDQMTGTLLFGNGSATSTLTRGIDANGTPIIRPLITWSATDYITATTQSNYVVDKGYIAKALSQHIQDEVHGAGGFVEIQQDGTGVFPNDVAFSAGAANKTYSLTWFDSTGTNNHKIYAEFNGSRSQLVLQAGTDTSDTIDFRHSTILAADPLFRIGAGSSYSYQSLYIMDGQPQPTFNGAVNASNDDTKGATKGFVRKYVTDNMPAPVDAGTTVSAATYAYDAANKRYNLTIKQSGVTDIVVDEYHEHNPYDTPYTYKLLPTTLDWVVGDVIADLAKLEYPSFPVVSVGSVIELLNKYKAPVTNAVFTNSPAVGLRSKVVSYNATSKQIRVYCDISVAQARVKVGATINIAGSASNNGNYVVNSFVAGAVLNNQATVIFTVANAIPTTLTETGNAYLTQGDYVPVTSPRSLVTRTTLDVEIDAATTTNYYYVKRTTAGTNIVLTPGFTYVPGVNKLWVFRNGQKLRVNTATGGDYNETSATTITVASVYANDEFEVYKI